MNSANQGKIAVEQTRVRVEDLQRRALEELSLEPEQLIAEFGPEVMVPVLPLDPDDVEKAEAAEPRAYMRAEQERALATAQKDLEKLGRVNPLALEEHEALAARHKFLVDQVQDLKASKADLLRIVQDVDRLVQEAFTAAFAETRKQFEHVFGVLFPGGQGDLVLTDPEDMLSTGIEIEARPAGKKVKRLSLLSGGERSLAAIAFLVAIFKARPSPFYVMDEVEAALDDVNLSRLLVIFKELQETSQLIVITHQKRTMEIADALYGVTMRDGDHDGGLPALGGLAQLSHGFYLGVDGGCIGAYSSDMATLNIKDERVHALATELARLRGTTATGAVLDALTVEMEKERANHAIDWQAFADVQRRCQGVDDPWLTDDDIYDSEGQPR